MKKWSVIVVLTLPYTKVLALNWMLSVQKLLLLVLVGQKLQKGTILTLNTSFIRRDRYGRVALSAKVLYSNPAT